MIAILKHIKLVVTVFTALTFAFTTSGFSLYQHYCTTSLDENLSIVIPAEKCNHATQNEKSESCCQPIETKSCCDTNTPKNENDCCHDEQEFKKLETSSTISQQPEIKALNTLIIEVLFSTTFLAQNYFDNNINELTTDSPPPPDIQDFLAQIQVYII